MKLQSKLFIGVGLVLSIALIGVVYTDTLRARKAFEAEVRTDAVNLQSMMAATRKVYIQQFKASGLPVTDETIGFLPAHAMSRIADDFINRTESGITFNNVSDRPRNSRNQADNVELEAIDYFRKNPEQKERIINYKNSNGELSYHFSAPIWIEQACLTCHGERSQAPAAVRDRYDNAWGYKLGELRGILSIKLPGTELTRRIDNHLQNGLILFGILFILTFVLLNGALDRLILRRIGRIKSAALALKTGHEVVLDSESGGDELSELASHFKQMAAEVSLREEELRQQASLQQAVINSAQDAIVMADESSHILLFNPVASKLFGYSADEVLGQPLGMLIPEKMKEHHEEGFNRYKSGGSPHVIGNPAVELEALHRDGTVFPIEMSLGEGHGGNQRIFVATIRDIRERVAIRADMHLAATAFEGLSPMVITDAKGNILRVNQAFSQVTGYQANEVIGQNPRLLQSGRQDESFYQNFWGMLKSSGQWQGELWNKRKNGEIYPEWLSIKAVHDADQQVSHYVGSFTDLTVLEKQRQLIEELAVEEKVLGHLLRLAVASTPIKTYLNESLDAVFNEVPCLKLEHSGGIFLMDEELQKLRLEVDQGMSQIERDRCLEVELGECLCGQAALNKALQFSPDLYISDESKAGVQSHSQYSLPILAEQKLLGVLALHLPQGHIPSDAEQGFLKRITDVLAMGISHRYTELAIEHQAYHDALTGLPNRRLLQNLLERELSVVNRRNLCGAVLFIDLDQFKHLNDSLGHSIGDELLIEVARRIKLDLREGDTVARLGGDEFVVLLPALGTDENVVSRQAQTVAEKLRVHLARTYNLSGYQHHISASIGVALLPGDVSTVDDILKHADAAMYVSKNKGRNCVSFYQPHLQEAVDERLFLETELRQAIKRNELQLYFQPQVNRQGLTFGAEALLRWNHSDRGFISPADFIPIAEETGLILGIGDWVCNTACAHMARWQSFGSGHILRRLAINVSPHQFHQNDFVDRIRHYASEHEVNPKFLELELTESIIVEDVESVIERMQSLKKHGFSISMDDFGTGYSSLNYLKRLPMDVLKIDQSFIRDVDKDPRDAAVVDTIISMSHFLGMEVIAEGVETREELDFLQMRGCPNYQGYYFSRPLPANDFDEWLKKINDKKVG